MLLGRGSRIYCVLRNFQAHALELHNPVPSRPYFFLKPSSALVREPDPILLPRGVDELHHEVELGVVIGKKTRFVTTAEAMESVAGYVCALDMTARSVQTQLKNEGLPWLEAKGCDTFAPVSAFVSAEHVVDPTKLELWCKVNGEERQRGCVADLVFDIPTLISHLSEKYTLEEGDLILTGTPKGVGPVQAGDEISAGISDFTDMKFKVEKIE